MARRVSKDFIASLRPGDLVAATVASSSKVHLIHIVRPITPEMLRGPVDEERRSYLFDARPMCELRPRYFWQPTDQLDTCSAESKCRWCFSKWRAAGRPLIKGWKKPEVPVADSLWLPWGWHEVAPVGHPLDLPLSAPDPEPDEEERKVGTKRVEVRLWIRGQRYVRITHELIDNRFCVRFGALDDKIDQEGWTLKGNWEQALLRAITLMALGGTPTSRTTDGKLTMRDITLKGTR